MGNKQAQSKGSGLGIWGWDTYEFMVNDLDRSRYFYTQQMKIPEVARLNEAQRHQRGEDSLLFQAAGISLMCTTSLEQDSRTGRWLKRHPDGVSILALRVRDLEQAQRVLESRGATFCTPLIAESDCLGNPYRYFEIATPLGDVRLRFTERSVKSLLPGFTPLEPEKTEVNPFHFQSIDHVTSNFLTIEPFITWLRDVIGLKEYWRIHFHTQDVRQGGGSGLASIVMWDPESKIKFANNEPAIPNYEASQIYTFVEDNHGPGVQHIAFHVPNIEQAVGGLLQDGIRFLDVPTSYYDLLPSRLQEKHISNFKENIDHLQKLGVLVDGADERYLLQIFMQEGGLLYNEAQAGPFFYEVIQRCGALGFGEGNFRALFEAIERDQVTRKKVETVS